MSLLSSQVTRRLSAPFVLTSHVEEHPRPKTSSFVRDEQFYLDDGNFVLVAENVAFRVHRSVLTRHSEYFRKLLLHRPVTYSLNGTNVFDGCPVLRLPNPSYEVSELLKILYDHVKLFVDDLCQLTGLLRLSVQFEIQYFTDFALEALSEAYPTALSSYDAYRGSRPRCGDVIKLAYQIPAHNMLPCAYYELCRYPMKITSTLDLPGRVLEDFSRGREHLAARLAVFIDSQIGDGSLVSECKLPVLCGDEWRDLKVEAQGMFSKSSTMTGLLPLSILGSMVDLPHVDAMCCACRRQFRHTIHAERVNIWSCLPKVFNFGSWDSLRAHGSG